MGVQFAFFVASIAYGQSPGAAAAPAGLEAHIERARSASVQVVGRWKSRRSGSLQWGAGVFIGDGSLVITSLHTIEGYPEVVVRTHDDRWHSSRVIGEFPEKDLAVLKVDADERYPAVDVVEYSVPAISAGFVVGYPQYDGRSIRAARISPVRGRVEYSRASSGAQFVAVESTLTAGFSGGPVFTADGGLVGIILASSTSRRGFALTTGEILAVLGVERLPAVPHGGGAVCDGGGCDPPETLSAEKSP
jgi:S1-C subfamily serine protease